MRVTANKVSVTVFGADSRNRDVVGISVLVMKNSVSVRESTSFNILSRNSHVVAFVDERSESKSLSSSPVDSLSLVDRGKSGLKDLGNLSVPHSSLRQSRDGNTKLLKLFFVEGSRDSSAFALGVLLNRSPSFSDPLFLVELVVS